MKIVLFAVIVLLFLFFIPTKATAQENEGEIYPIDEGERAPFSGILLDPAAAAKILADENSNDQKSEAECQLRLDLAAAESKLVTDLIQNSLEFEQKAHLQTITSYDDRLKDLQDYSEAVEEDSDSLLWLSFGIAGGIAITSLTFGIIEASL